MKKRIVYIITMLALLIACRHKDQDNGINGVLKSSVENEGMKKKAAKEDGDSDNEIKENKPPLVKAIEEENWDTVLRLLESNVELPLVEEKTTLLHLLARQKSVNLEVARKLIEKGNSVNAENSYGRTPLHVAASNGHLDLVRLLVEKGSNINAPDKNGDKPFHEAAKSENVDLVKYFLNNKVDINIKGDNNKTPLIYAVSSNSINIVKLLLSEGADVESRDSSNFSPLICSFLTENHWRVEFNDEIVEELINHGANIHGSKSDDPAIFFALNCCAKKSLKVLLKHGAKISVKTTEGDPIWYYVMRDSSGHSCPSSEMVSILLDNGMSIDVKNQDGESFLIDSMYDEGADIAELLLKRGVNPNVRSKDGDTPLIKATKMFNEDLVKLLLEKKADPNALNKQKRSALWLAINLDFGVIDRESREKIIIALIDAGAKVNERSEEGENLLYTYLRKTSAGVSDEVLKKLAMQNINVKEKNKDGESIIFLACDRHLSTEFMDILLSKGISIEEKDAMGRTPLMRTLMLDDVDQKTVEYLIKKGAKINARDNFGSTALIIAVNTKRYREVGELYDLLLKNGAQLDAVNQFGLGVGHCNEKMSSQPGSYWCDKYNEYVYLMVEKEKLQKGSKAGTKSFVWPNGNRVEGPVNSKGELDGEAECVINGKASQCNYSNGIRITEGTVFLDGDYYKGTIPIGTPHGQGTMHFLNSDYYTGEWSSDKKMTKNGIYTWANLKATYQGEYDNRHPEGEGMCTKDGKTEHCKAVAGMWLREGYGVIEKIHLFSSVFSGKYVGPMKNGKPDGLGMWREYNNESEYWGEWKEGKPHGHGVYSRRCCEIFIGTWMEGKQHGVGECIDYMTKSVCYYYQDDKYQYIGQTKNGLPNGKGTLFFRGSLGLLGDLNNHYYQGELRNGLYHGKGVLVKDGVKYEGHFVEGKKQGHGTTICPGIGHAYAHQGEYKDDEPHGYGYVTWEYGKQYIGNFVSGKAHGKGRCSKKNAGEDNRREEIRNQKIPKRISEKETVSCTYDKGEEVNND